MDTDCTILILSCDKYADLWKPFFQQFHKHWKDCPYPVVLGSNTVVYKNKKVRTILSGPDSDWSTSLLSILQQIETPYVFLWLDDIFPISDVRTKRFADALASLGKNDGVHMHMMPTPKPDEQLANGKYGVYKKGAPYRVNSVGFWGVAALRNLLLPGESPWSFEIMGSYRSSFTDGFYCSMKPLFERLHVIEKGKIFQDAHEYCQKHGIPLDLSKRPILASGRHLRSELQKIYFNTMILVPWQIRLAIMSVFRKLLISY
jgi:hypothetical protein